VIVRGKRRVRVYSIYNIYIYKGRDQPTTSPHLPALKNIPASLSLSLKYLSAAHAASKMPLE
jgi:hypothetical protein